uniref:Ig-like domain-containing protein n=1 Tax=Leptobrachium leishanense TaxID=445787 RepID=A0A8C5PS77_9ANUR
MRILFLLHAALIYLPCLCVGVNVDQSPKLSVVEAGKPVELQCNSDDSTYYVMLWYQQKPGQGLKLMRYSTAEKDEKEPMEEGFTSWKWNRPTLLESSLKLDKPQLEDSAVYFCAVSTQSQIPGQR